MKKTDPRVDAYIAKSAPFARPILRRLRGLVRTACPQAEETIKWGMPAFVLDGKILCGMAAFKAHATFGFWRRELRQAVGPRGSKADEAMGNFGRIGSLADLPSDAAMRGYIRKAAALTLAPAPGRTPRPRKPARALPVPADLAAALRKNRAASSAFDGFSPSRRNEYVDWITEAKRAETRATRLATAVAWIAEGKSRNWKYEKC